VGQPFADGVRRAVEELSAGDKEPSDHNTAAADENIFRRATRRVSDYPS